MRPGTPILAIILTLLIACDDVNDMRQYARLRPLEAPMGSRTTPATNAPPLGTVPTAPGYFSDSARPSVDLSVLQAGRVRFDTFCAPCHARDGYGDGIIPRHGFPTPPSLHDPVIRERDDAHYFRVMRDGLGKMPSYGDQIGPADAWATVAYIRALQLSQNAPASAVPAGVRPVEGQGVHE